MFKGILAALLLTALPAVAQQNNCAPREIMLEGLAEKYGESRQNYMLAGPIIVEIYANLETGSASIVTTNPAGISCLMVGGVSYENVEEALVPTGLKI